MSKRLLYLFAVIALLLASACGDDDDSADTEDTTAPTTEPTATTEPDEGEEGEGEALALDEWVEAADEICAEADDAFAEIDEIPSDPTADELAAILEESLPIGESQNEDIEDLGLPAEDEELVEEALELLADGVGQVEDALEAAEDGDVDAAFEALSDAEARDRLAEIADDLGLEVCGQGGTGDTTDTTTDAGDDEPFTYGDDAALDELWDACDDGDPEACDELWAEGPSDSDYEEFGFSCGNRVPEDEVAACSDVMGEGDDDIGIPSEPDGYGDDAALDALWDACEDGDGQACDDLFFDSPVGSEYEEFGKTCGGRLEGLDAETEYCVDAI